MSARSRFVLAAVVAAAVGLGTVAVVGARWGDTDARAGTHAARLVVDDDRAVLGPRSVVVGDHLVSNGDRVTWRDLDTLALVGSVGRTGTLTWMAVDPPTVLVGSTADGLAAHAPGGAELWHVDLGRPVAAAPDGSVVVSRCEGDRCTLVALETDGTQRWSTELDGGGSPVAFADGPLLGHPGGRGQLVLPPIAVASIATASGPSDVRDVVRLDPETGDVIVVRAAVPHPDVVVTAQAIAVLVDADRSACSLVVLDHDGTGLGELAGDCTDPADGVDVAYLYAEPGALVWVGADRIRSVDPATGAEVWSAPVGDPAGTPTPAGILRPGEPSRDGWSLRRVDDSEVLVGSDWEWAHDVTVDGVVVGRLVTVGPPWRRSTVHEIAVVDPATGDVCGRQRVPTEPFPAAIGLPGCRAVVAAGGDEPVNWLLGGR